jgi:DHA2 family methylenomycin A resistance protein-like MFS transporter
MRFTASRSRRSPFLAQHAVLLATSVSYVLVLIDASVLNVALARIGEALGGGVSALQWVVNAYTLCFAGFLLTGGTLGDRLGARTVYRVGLALFGVSSALCGAATTMPWLAAARAFQGIGSALIVPCSLALINRAYTQPRPRATAISVWMGCGGIAMAAAPLVGGTLIDTVGWRAIFMVNVPIAAIGVALSLGVRDDDRAPRSRKLDWGGQLTAIVALVAFIGALIEGPSRGWHSASVVTAFALALTAFPAFIAIERRRADPMLPLSLFRHPLFAASAIVSLASAFVFYGLIFALSLYFQKTRGLTPLATGVAFLPMTVMLAAAGLYSNRIATALGQRVSMPLAFAVYMAGAIAMSLLARVPSPAAQAFALIAIGLAAGFVSPAATSPALGTVDKSRSAIAAAVLNTARQTGAALGVAAFGTCVAARATLADAVVAACIGAAIVALAALVLWVVLTRPGRMPGETHATARLHPTRRSARTSR